MLVRSQRKIDIAIDAKLTFWEGDITIPASITGLMENVDVIYHFAAQLGEWGLPEDLFYSVNVKGTQNLLDECRKNSNSRFIFISTPGVQGKGHKQAKESLPYNPPNIYEQTKCEAEKLVIEYNKLYGLSMGIVRPDFVYGPGDYRRLSLYRAISRKRFLIIGTGKSILHPTYVDDVIKGLLLIGQNKAGLNGIFNIAGPEQLTVENYIKIMAQVMGATTYRLRIPLPIGKAAAIIFEKMSSFSGKPPFISRSKVEFLTRDHGTDITKAKNVLNFFPRYGFETGFGLTFNWAKQNNLL
jgi:nucleoside-diphosphate-sugar epimerase